MRRLAAWLGGGAAFVIEIGNLAAFVAACALLLAVQENPVVPGDILTALHIGLRGPYLALVAAAAYPQDLPALSPQLALAAVVLMLCYSLLPVLYFVVRVWRAGSGNDRWYFTGHLLLVWLTAGLYNHMLQAFIRAGGN